MSSRDTSSRDDVGGPIVGLIFTALAMLLMLLA